MNALKTGLAGEGLILPDEHMEAVRERADMWCSSFRPPFAFDAWLVERVAVESVRADLCQWHEAVAREGTARRAVTFWDEDRRASAAELALGLSKKPEHVGHQLRRTKQGAEWLIGRWRSLGQILESHGTWDADQRSLALDLLGVPRELRNGPTPLVPGPGHEEAGWLAELARREEEQLVALRDDVLEALDAREREEAMAGVERRPDPELRRLRRYEAGCLRRLRDAVACLRARKRESMPHQPERPDRHERPSRPSDEEMERREVSAHQEERSEACETLAGAGMGRPFADPDALVASALRETEPHDGDCPAPPVADAPADDLSELLAEPVEAPPLVSPIGAPAVPGVLKPVSLASALRPPSPAADSYRARIAARIGARRL
jgi:hypothetical protein